MNKKEFMTFWTIITVASFSTFVIVNIVLINHQQQQSIHTHTLNWSLQYIESGECIGEYIKNWTLPHQITILQVEVWMGNPYNITWEGDSILTTTPIKDPWNPNEDEVIIHYQFDSHDLSPLTHFRIFDLRPGFIIEKGETLYVYRLFNNFDEKPTYSGDGWVRLYYLYT